MNNHSKESHTQPEFGLDVPIFTKLYDFYKQLTYAVATFPKTKRYSLGQKLDNLTLDLFELLFSIPSSKNKIPALQKISLKIDLLKILLRLAKDTQTMGGNKYLELQLPLQEIGKMIGGWMRYRKNS